jgi:hypothetical protein
MDAAPVHHYSGPVAYFLSLQEGCTTKRGFPFPRTAPALIFCEAGIYGLRLCFSALLNVLTV